MMPNFTLRTALHSFDGMVYVGMIILFSVSAQAQNLFETDYSSGHIYEFTNNNGTLSSNRVTFASGLSMPSGLVFDGKGNLFVTTSTASSRGGKINEFTNNNGILSSTPTTFASGFNLPVGLVFDSAGNLFVGGLADSIYEFTNNNGVLNSTPIPTFSAGVAFGLAFDSTGNLFVASFTNNILEFTNNNGTLSSNLTIFASGLNRPIGLAFDGAGNLFESDSRSGKIYEFKNNSGTLSSNLTIFASGLNEPGGLAFDSAGNLFESDNGSGKINEFKNNNGTLSSTATTFASGLGPYFLAFQPVNNVSPVFQAITIAGNLIAITWNAQLEQTYQLQYSTNLAQTNWTNLGDVIIATNVIMITSNIIGSDPQQFYRLVSP